MKNNQIKKIIGCLIVIFFILITIYYVGNTFVKAYHREPELPLKDLVSTQIASLPDNWYISREEIWKDSDFTDARWAYMVNFNNNKQIYSITEEIHFFANSTLAKIFRYPSPTIYFSDKSYSPDGWKYIPKRSDYFGISCIDDGKYVEITRNCQVIVRYIEYTIVITSPINNAMNLEDLEEYLYITDLYMGQYIDNSNLLSGPSTIPTSVNK